MAEPLSGLCTRVCVGDWACVFPSPRLPALIHQVFISNATRLLKPSHVSFSFLHQNLLRLHLLLPLLCVFLFSLLPSSFPRSLPLPFLPAFSFHLPPSTSRRPLLLSEEIDWVIWPGASSCPLSCSGEGEKSGGDMTTCRNNNNTHNIGRVSTDGEVGGVKVCVRVSVGGGRWRWWMSSFCRFSGRLSVLNIAGTQTAFHNIVLPFLSSPPSVFFSHPRPASISDDARSADRRWARGHRLCAPLFTFCLTSEWKKGQSPPPPASAAPHPREATKPKKCCPQAVCVFRWRSASNRSTRSNVIYDAPPPRRFILGTHKKKKVPCFSISSQRRCEHRLPDLRFDKRDRYGERRTETTNRGQGRKDKRQAGGKRREKEMYQEERGV